MNIVGRADLMDILAAQYALGTMRGGARRRLEALAKKNSDLRRRMDVWASRLGGLAELQGAKEPPERVWEKVSKDLAREAQAAPIAGGQKP